MLSLSNEDYFLEEVDSHIQANLEDAVVQEALKNGVDLREYSKNVEEELKKAENSCISDFIRESQNIATLHHEIVDCDQILERMENMLLTFQSDLGSISNEILSLQQQSVQMNVKLKNRQAIRGELSQFVDDMIVPEEMILTLMEKPVSDIVYLEHLQNLEHKINFLHEQSFRDARACNDVKDVVEKLKIKAVGKIREFLLEKINSFKKPMTNYHIQQNTILKFRFYFKFLVANNIEIAKEVKENYVDTMSKVTFSYFKSYSGRLMKLQYDELPTQDDLLGLDDSQPKGFFSKPSIKSKASVFSMGQRGEVLSTELEGPILVPHALEKNSSKCPYEKLFRSEQYAFMENACREYIFISEFFMVSNHAAEDLFNQIMGKTLTLLQKNVEDYVHGSCDCIALFLCSHLTVKFRQMCRDKGVNAMERYWSTILAFLWPKLQKIIQMNVQSVKDCDPHKMKSLDLRPHFVIRRYAELSAAFVSINENCSDESFHSLLSVLHYEIDHFILRTASMFPRRKEQLIFAINNYDLILSVMGERSNSESRDSEDFRQKFDSKTSDYIEETLKPHFGDLIQFITECETLIEKGQDSKLRSYEQKSGTIIISFNGKWKSALDELNKEVLGSFPNFKNGTNILQQALTQFVQYYHRFHKIMSMSEFSQSAQQNFLINVHQLIVEVKKYKPNF